MPVSLTCPGCAAGFTVPDTLAGKWIKCKSCGTSLEVTAPVAARGTRPAARPVRPAVVDDADEADDAPVRRKPAPAGASKLPLILAAVGAFVLVGGGLGGYLAFSGGSKPKDVAVTPAAPVEEDEAPEVAKPAAQAKAAAKPPAEVSSSTTPAAAKPPAKAVETPPAAPASGGTVAPLSPGAVRPLPTAPTAGTPTPAPNKTDIDQLTLDRCKNGAVLIRCDRENGYGHGSGWFGLEPNLIFTNAHVVSMLAPNSPKPKKLTVWVNPGTPREVEIPHSKIEIMAVDRDMDLALLRIQNMTDLPPPYKVRPSAGLRDLENLVVLGYPGGTRLSERNRTDARPNVTVAKALMQTLRADKHGNTYSVQIQSNIVHGNSGGPIVDVDGNVVAVAVRVDLDQQGRFTGIAYGVPTEYVTGLLAGRVGEVEFGQAYKNGSNVHIPVTVNCLDPFNRLTSVGVACWVGEKSNKSRPPGATRTGADPADRDYKEVALTYKHAKDKQVATGELVLPTAPTGQTYWAQPYYSNQVTAKQWLAGNEVRMLGAPVERTPVELTAKFRPGTVRTLTLSNKNSVEEFEEGEGADRSERVLVETLVKGREVQLRPDRGTDYGAINRMRFESVEMKAERGVLKQDNILPKEIRKLFAEGIKLCEGAAWLAKTGEVVKTQADVRNPGLQPYNEVYRVAVIDPVMDALMAASVRLPNERVDPGKTWKQTKQVRLAIRFAAGPEEKKGDDDGRGQQPSPAPKGTGKPKDPRVREYKYQEEITYKYVGLRTRQGSKEAVLEVAGTISAPPGTSEGNSARGKVKGYAFLDVDTGAVIKAEVDREFEVDTSADGVKRRLSGVNTYSIDRGPATAGAS